MHSAVWDSPVTNSNSIRHLMLLDSQSTCKHPFFTMSVAISDILRQDSVDTRYVSATSDQL